ncbi:MAG: DUF177 domain-containing protein [Candidatus Sabulitectum sp.]|nr:DUF177 domain-containing protein [Candidatus Sabulitectum sp.]
MRIFEENLSITINSIPRGTTRETFTLEMKNVPWDIPGVDISSEEGLLDLDIVRTEYEIIVKGFLEADFTVQCARCLAPVTFPVTVEIERMYSWNPDMLSDPEVEPVSHNDGTVCILDPVREAIIFSLPSMPLCTEKCRGLCPRCGINRNMEECEHGFEA